MKNLKVKIGLVSILIIGIAITGFLYSCEKEDKKETTKTQAEIAENLDKDYQTYIDELMAKTGVDIYALSQLSEVKKIVENNVRMIENSAKNSTKICHTESTNADDEALIRLKNLYANLQTKYNAGNYEAALLLYDSMYTIAKTINGFVVDFNIETGTGSMDYKEISTSIGQLESIRQLEAQQVQATRLMTEVSRTSVEFTRLSEPLQIEVLSAAMFVSSADRLTNLNGLTLISTKSFSTSDQKPSAATIESCIDKSTTWLAGKLFGEATAATIAWARCASQTGLNPWTAFGCGVAFFGGGVVAGIEAVITHRKNVKLCEAYGTY